MSQIFKAHVNNDILICLFDNICVKMNNYYFFNTNAFKKGVFNNKIQEFLIACKPFYHSSKQKYLDNKLTYNSFTTVLRQICKFNQISFTSKIKYDKSNYEIQYFVYI